MSNGRSSPASGRPGRISIQHIHPKRLSAQERDEIWAFLSRFVRRSRPVFEEALLASDEVCLARDTGDGSVVAFIAKRVFTVEWEGRPISIIHTPWTAIDAAYRGRNITQREGLRAYLLERLRHPLRPSYWVMSSSTYLSYQVLTRNFARFWPKRGEEMPRREVSIIEQVMVETGETNWDSAAGVVRRFGATKYREGLVSQTDAAKRDEDVRYYASRNPNQDEGDTLVCIIPLVVENWRSVGTRAGLRLLRRRRSTPHHSEQPAS